MTSPKSVAQQAFSEARMIVNTWRPDDSERPVAVKMSPPNRLSPYKINQAVANNEARITETARSIAEGRITARQLVEESLEAIEAFAELNAFAYVAGEAALAEADVLDMESKAGKSRGPLHGIPISVKDVIHVADMPTKAGSEAYEKIPRQDAIGVARLRAAGAIIIGKSTTHEFALGVTTPQAKNPHDPSRIPGGSSGGSAIAVAKGMGLASLGTDTRASIRIPPSLSGVVGFKPTIGVVPTDGVVPLSWTMDHVAPITTTVADSAILLDILISPTPGLTSYNGVSIKGLKVGVPEAAFVDCHPGVSKAVLAAINKLESLGAKIITLNRPSLDDLKLANAAGLLVSRCEAITFHRGIGTDLNRCWQEIHDQLDEASRISSMDYITAQRCRSQLATEMLTMFDTVDVLAMPTSLVTAPKIQDAPKYLMVLSRNAIIWSFVGFPALSMPCRDWVDGLPAGLQLVGPPNEERLLVALGTAYEQTNN